MTNASYTPYCIALPTAPSITGLPMPNGGGQQCGYFDLIRPTTPSNLVIQSADNFGGVEDVYDGFDFDANARLGRGIILSGGVSIGRERTNSCNLSNDLSLVFQSGVGRGDRQRRRHSRAAHVGVLRRPPAVPAERQGTDHVSDSRGGIGGSLSFQSVPGAQINAQYPLTNTTPGLTLGRPFSSVAPTVDIVAPGTLYLDRIYQTDIRFTKNFKVGATTRFVRRSRSTTCSTRTRRTRSTRIHSAVRRGLAGADRHPDAAVPRLRRAGRLLVTWPQWLSGSVAGGSVVGDDQPRWLSATDQLKGGSA